MPTDVVGTATSDDLCEWQLEHRLRGDAEWARFATGTTPVVDGPLGLLDPSLLLNGLHEVRLSVTDTAGRIARATTIVVVREQPEGGQLQRVVRGPRGAGRGPADPGDPHLRQPRQAEGATSATAGGWT